MSSKRNKRILVVDDSSSIRLLIAGTLEEMNGFNVTEAADGFEAIRLVAGDDYDLVITDVNMPEITGLELVRFIRTHSDLNRIPIIIISTEGSDTDQKKAMDLGANAYLVKPFETSDLKTIVLKVLGDVHARR